MTATIPDRLRTEKTCNGCVQTLSIEAFAFKKAMTGRRQSRCRKCHATARRDHYLANKPKILKQVDRRNRMVRKQNVAHVVEYLSSHPCVDCGEADPVVLHFDHISGERRASSAGFVRRPRRNVRY